MNTVTDGIQRVWGDMGLTYREANERVLAGRVAVASADYRSGWGLGLCRRSFRVVEEAYTAAKRPWLAEA